MPTVRTHKNRTKTFEELTFLEQQKSIRMSITLLGKNIMANRKRAVREKQPDGTLGYVKNLFTMILRVLAG
jgi:hypothetical protein